MKKLVLLTLFIALFSSYTYAQHPSWQDSTTVFVKERGYLKDPIRSKWKSHIKKIGQFWVLSLYDKKNVIQEQIQFGDEDLSIRKGPYSAYTNGVLNTKGQYEKGNKHGLWRYFDAKGQLLEEANYFYDKYHGTRTTFWPNTQKKRVENYVNGKLHGILTTYNSDGTILSEEDFENGVKQPSM